MLDIYGSEKLSIETGSEYQAVCSAAAQTPNQILSSSRPNN